MSRPMSELAAFALAAIFASMCNMANVQYGQYAQGQYAQGQYVCVLQVLCIGCRVLLLQKTDVSQEAAVVSTILFSTSGLGLRTSEYLFFYYQFYFLAA